MDRHLFIDDAIKNGAIAVIVDKDIPLKSVPLIKVDDTNKSFSEILPKFYNYPLDKLKLIGITGTDGKTTTATIIQELIDNCGYIGTNGVSCNGFYEKTSNTTPDLDKLYPYFDIFLKNGVNTVVMEVSSEALNYNRTRGITFDASILTNITKEHLNTHKTMENYIACKCKLFETTNGFSVLNKDDSHFEEVRSKCQSKVYTYGINEENDLQIKDVKLLEDKTIFTIKYQNNEYEITSPLLALFNVYNLSSALLTLLIMGYKIEELVKRIPNLSIDGRLQKVDLGQDFKVFVDYAHTPNGIKELLTFMNKIPHNKLIVLFSEPGERDKSKRPEKGYNVVTNCDYAIVTSQDPRFENPVDIANDLISLVKDYTNYEIILDRKEAIKKAIDIASKDDIVLIIGKGNEHYQIIQDKIVEFNDTEEVTKALKDRI